MHLRRGSLTWNILFWLKVSARMTEGYLLCHSGSSVTLTHNRSGHSILIWETCLQRVHLMMAQHQLTHCQGEVAVAVGQALVAREVV